MVYKSIGHVAIKIERRPFELFLKGFWEVSWNFFESLGKEIFENKGSASVNSLTSLEKLKLIIEKSMAIGCDGGIIGKIFPKI